MSSAIGLFTVLSLFPAVMLSEALWELKCTSAFGIVGQPTVIRCFITNSKDPEIIAVSLTKVTPKQPVFEIYGEEKDGDERFNLENRTNGPSLRISDTKFSDEGEYQYNVTTDSGKKKAKFSINVTAKYKEPVINTWPKNVTDGGPADLYCNATDGYPAGFIHWFDRSDTNWTINSYLEKVPKDTNGSKSVALSSKLHFQSIDLGLAPFRCVVLSSKFEKDGENSITFTPNSDPFKNDSQSKTKHIIAGVMVIGLLCVGLLFAVLLFRRRRFSQGRRPSAHPLLTQTGYNQGDTTDKDQQSANW